MTEFLNDAKEEMKRADHLIYVSLKYTRTVDVIKNIIDRLINAYDFSILHLLEVKKDEGKFEEIPSSVGEKIALVKKLYPEPMIESSLEFYSFLRILTKAEYTRQREFRRHVTMSAFIPDKGVVEVTIDVIHEYYEKTKEFIKFSELKIEE